LRRLAEVQVIVWGFAAAGIYSIARSRNKARSILVVGWLLASFVGVSASGYYFPHYFQQILPAVAISAGLGAEATANVAWCKGAANWLRLLWVTIFLAALPLWSWVPFARLSPAEACRRIFPLNIFTEMPNIGGYIAQNTRPDERVFVFGAEAEILFYAQRVSATRYIFLFPLYGPYRDALTQQKATAAEVESNRPKIVAYFPNGLFYKPGTEQFFTAWTDSWLHDHFRPEIYVTRDAAGIAQFTRAPAAQKEFVAPPGEQLVGIIFARNEASAPD